MNKNQPKNLTTALWAGHIGLKMGRLALIMGLFVGLFMGQFGGMARADDLPAPLPVKTLEMALPDTAIRDQYGADVRLSDFKGTPLLVNFWATWCAPCVHELPALEAAAKTLDTDMRVLLVSMDRGSPARPAAFLEERGIVSAFTAYDAKATWARALSVRGLPTSLILSHDQTQAWIVSGPAEWDDKKILSQLRGLLAE